MGGRASLVNCCRTRTVCQLCTPKGCPAPFMPGLKSMADTILRVPWMSKTQCAAVSTCFSPISVPVHSSALRRRRAVRRGRRRKPWFPQGRLYPSARQTARPASAAPRPVRMAHNERISAGARARRRRSPRVRYTWRRLSQAGGCGSGAARRPGPAWQRARTCWCCRSGRAAGPRPSMGRRSRPTPAAARPSHYRSSAP